MEQNDVINLAARLAQGLDTADGSAPPKERKPEDAKAVADRNDRLRKKVRTIARMARMFKTLRQENESVIRLKGVCPGHRLPPGLLLTGRNALSIMIYNILICKVLIWILFLIDEKHCFSLCFDMI